MAVEAQIEGVDELRRVLTSLPDALARNVLASVARAGAEQLQKAAYARLALAMRHRTPREDDVIIRSRRPGGKGYSTQAEYAVGPPRRKPWLRWLNNGVKAHTIAIRNRKVLYSSRLEAFFGRSVEHPGQMPTFWMESAVQMSSEQVYKAMAVKLREALPKQVKKLVSDSYRNKQIKGIFSNLFS